MKKILIMAFLLLGICSARSQSALLRHNYNCNGIPVTFWYTGNVLCTPPCSGDQTILVNVEFSTSNPGGTLGPNPFKTQIELYDPGFNIISSSTGVTSSPYFAQTYSFGSLAPGAYQAKILFQKFNITGWVNVGTYWTNVMVKDACPPPTCWQLPPPTISGTYTTTLTESVSWIKTSGSTIIPGGASVALDAEASSYVELNDGFETQPNSIFVAQALNGCSAGAPQFMIVGPPDTEVAVSESGSLEKAMSLADFTPENKFVVYPNPTAGLLTVQHPEGLTRLQVFDVMGKLVLTVPVEAGTETRLDLSEQPKGIYLLMADGQPTQQIVKL
jgi:hypothetical protein